MKKTLLLTLSLLSTPLFAGPYCMDNSEHLAQSYDNKEWHSVECDCNCQKEPIKGGKCIECQHLQEARPFTIVRTSTIKTVQQNKIQGPQTVKEALNNLMLKYKSNH